MRPIEPIIDHAITTPITSHVMSVPNPPRSSAPGAQPSILVSSVPSNAWGKPLPQPMLSGTKIVPSQGVIPKVGPRLRDPRSRKSLFENAQIK